MTGLTILLNMFNTQQPPANYSAYGVATLQLRVKAEIHKIMVDQVGRWSAKITTLSCNSILSTLHKYNG